MVRLLSLSARPRSGRAEEGNWVLVRTAGLRARLYHP